MQLTYESKGTNTFLVYTMEEGEILDSTSMGMLANNHIKGVLPLNYSQQDAIRYIKYNVSAKVSLSEYFKGVVNRTRLIRVLSSLADAVMNAEDYMLEASAFLWDKDYIFVDAGTAEASLICIPEEGRINSKVDLRAFFHGIVGGVGGVTFDSSEDCNYVAGLISFLNSSANFSLKEFSRTLKEIGSGSGSVLSTYGGNGWSGGIGTTQHFPGSPAGTASTGVISPGSGAPGQGSAVTGDAGEKPGADGMTPWGINIPGGANVPDGIPTPVKNTETAGRKGRHWPWNKPPKDNAGKEDKKDQRDKEDKRNKKDSQDKNDKKNKRETDNAFGGMAIPGQAPVSELLKTPEQHSGQEAAPGKNIAGLEDKTEISEDKTETSEDMTEVMGDIVPGIWLELTSVAVPGLMTRIDLNFSTPFITLGRLSADEKRPDIAFPRELKKIGRQHARIERRGSEFYVVDLGSVNHTLLNDRILTPNQPYLLKEGMELAFTTGKLVSYRVHTM